MTEFEKTGGTYRKDVMQKERMKKCQKLAKNVFGIVLTILGFLII